MVTLLVHAELIVIEAAVDKGAGHRGIIRGIRVHVRHLTLVTHGDAPGRLVLHIVDIVVSLETILSADLGETVCSADLEVQEFISVDSGVAEVEAGGHVLLRAVGKRHEAALLHRQVGRVDPLIGVPEVITHVAGVRHHKRVAVIVRFVFDEKTCFCHYAD